jgi:2-hydroxychromene-2-carboxylate isomerase
MMKKTRFNACATVLVLVVLLLMATPLFAQVAEGDRHYAARGEGAVGARAKAQNVDAAIAAYERAIAANANDIVAHARLLRAYRFKGAYVAASNEEKKKVYGTAKVAGDRALAAVNRLVAAKGVKPDAAEKKVAEVARGIAGAPDVYLWDAINWGEWALAYGKMAAARQGAADRIRREATIAHLANPALEGGAASRVLGRLHDQTPRIPFITGWASGKEALRFLNESLKHDPANKVTLVFLAEAMVSNDSGTKPQAVALLRRAVSEPLHTDFPVEDAAAVEDAKALLKKWGA